MLAIATVCCYILYDRMISYKVSIDSQPICHIINGYINDQMKILMINVNINAIFLELLSIILKDITSLHREFGDERDGCATI